MYKGWRWDSILVQSLMLHQPWCIAYYITSWLFIWSFIIGFLYIWQSKLAVFLVEAKTTTMLIGYSTPFDCLAFSSSGKPAHFCHVAYINRQPRVMKGRKRHTINCMECVSETHRARSMEVGRGVEDNLTDSRRTATTSPESAVASTHSPQHRSH